MKSKRLFQIFVSFVLLFSPLGNNRPVRASNSSRDLPVLIQRNSPALQGTTPVPPLVYIAVNPLSIGVGGTAIATVNLDSAPDEGYTSMELTCSYDPSLLEVSNIIVDDLFGADPVAAINGPRDGYFIVAIAGSHGSKTTGNGPIFAFSVKGMQAGQTALNCRVYVPGANNQLINVFSTPARITILGNPLTPTIVPAVCDRADFAVDISIPPGTVMSPGATFTKTWYVANIGSCTWTPYYQLVFFSGEQMGGPVSANFFVHVEPGQILAISLDLIAPSAPGSYRGYWMFKNANGALFGAGPQGNQPWFVDIVVSDATLTPTVTQSRAPNTPTATPTPTRPTSSPSPSITPGGPTATPVAGVIYDFAVNACMAKWYSGTGQLPCPGIDGNLDGFVLKLDHPTLENGVIDARPGLLTFPQNIQNGYIQGFYPPFHVQDGDRFRTDLGCEGGATNCYVAFRLDYQIGTDPIRTFWGPFLERYDAHYFSMDFDLSSLAGKDVKFILTVLSVGSALDDRALWVGPIIYRPSLTIATPTFTSTLTSTSFPTFTPSPTQEFSPTPTDTPSALPEGSGHITGRVHAGRPVLVNIFDADNAMVTSLVTDNDGVFNYTTLPGSYTVIATAEGFLSAKGFVTVTDGTINTMPVINLLIGDIDDNNVIDQFDAMTIGMNYNNRFPDAADLNRDGIINVLDLELLAKNYRKAGPVEWQ